VALSSGTAALHLALEILGVGRGDEVITSTLTFAATANAICYLGATPVFVDVSPETWNLDPDLLDEELAKRARLGRQVAAVIAVDLYGQCAEYGRIEAICQRHGVRLLEDAAEGLGATCGSRHAGAFGDCAAFSFNGNKIITTSGGGMLVSHRRGVVERARHLSTQARQPVAHYEHEEVGYNYRLSNLLAAVGRGQLAGLDGKVAHRRAVRAAYRSALAGCQGIEFMPEAVYGRSNAWLTCITIDPLQFGADREAVRLFLEGRNIESRPVWKPMHLQPVFRDAPVCRGSVAAALFETGLCLPSGSNLAAEDQQRVTSCLHQLHTAAAAACVRA
jgi:pyridoxal phosphate-dependent aminotransferase EpsN